MYGLLLKLWKVLHLPKNLQLFIMRRLNDQFIVGVTGVIFDKKDRILLFRHTYRNVDRWSLPGGYIKSKEHPKEGLEREIEEESGFVVSADERLAIRTDRTSPRIEIPYVGTYIGGKFRPSKEVSEAKFFAFDRLPNISQDQLYFIEKGTKERQLLKVLLKKAKD